MYLCMSVKGLWSSFCLAKVRQRMLIEIRNALCHSRESGHRLRIIVESSFCSMILKLKSECFVKKISPKLTINYAIFYCLVLMKKFSSKKWKISAIQWQVKISIELINYCEEARIFGTTTTIAHFLIIPCLPLAALLAPLSVIITNSADLLKIGFYPEGHIVSRLKVDSY